METDRLKQFRVVVETGSLRKVAQLLHISHGGLSKSLKVLENELGVRLIAPDGRGIKITEKGVQVYESSLDLLRQVEKVMAANAIKPRSRGRLSIGTSEIFSTYFLETLLAHQRDGLALHLRELLPSEMERTLLERKIDIAITYLPIPAEGVEFFRAGAMPMGIFTSINAFEGVPAEELPFAVPIDRVNGAPTGQKKLDGWPEELFLRKEKFEVTLMESAMQLCRNGRAAVFLPHFIADLSNRYAAAEYQLVPRRFPDRISEPISEIFLVTRKGYLENEVVRRIAKAIRLGVGVRLPHPRRG